MKYFLLPVGNEFDIKIAAENDDETLDAFIQRVSKGLTIENLELARESIAEVIA